MKSVRIEPIIENGRLVLLVDVVCDCGQNALLSSQTGKHEVKQPIVMGKSIPKVVLKCEPGCGKTYSLVSQENHLHIFSD